MISSLAAPMTAARTPRNTKSMHLFKNELNRRVELQMRQQQHQPTKPDYEMIPTSIKDFGPESHLTPPTSMRDCELPLCMPPPLRKFDYCDKKRFLIVRREGLQTASILIPSIGSKRDNLADSPLSLTPKLFRLHHRAEPTCNSPPRLRCKSATEDIADFCIRRQTKTTKKSKLGMKTLQARKFSYKHFPSLGNLQATSIRQKPMDRSQSYTALFCLRRQTKNTTKSKLGLNALHARKLSFPSFGNIQAASIRLKPMERSQSYTAMSA